MDKLQVEVEDLKWARDIIETHKSSVSNHNAAESVVNWLDYMIAGMEQAVKMQEKVWTTKE